jgi:pyridoxamine 5'-phosphate oxidase
MEKLKHVRQDYNLYELKKSHLTKDPMKLFKKWMQGALDQEIEEPTAMDLCTVNAKGRPSCRIVLLKGFDERGFLFYTNYNSQKGREMEDNPHVALNIFWKPLHRQVRVEGLVEKVPRKESEAYFASRPRASQVGAWSSSQSEVLKSRKALLKRYDKNELKFAGKAKVPCPPHWGGYVVRPTAVEFWQGRTSRLHDRFRYELKKDGSWKAERLWP